MKMKLGVFALIAAMSCGVSLAQNNPFAGQLPVKAEIKKSFSSRDKAGAEFSVTTTSDVMIGTVKLPKGSILVGHVVDALRHSKDVPDGTVAILFDQAKPKKGDPIAISASLYKILPADDSGQRADSVGMRGNGATSTGTAPMGLDSQTQAAVATRPGQDANNKMVNGSVSASNAPVQVASYIPGVAISAVASTTKSGVLTAKNSDVDMLAGMNLVIGVAPASK